MCFDIGANIGNRTDVFLKLGATVVAIEPQDECVKILTDKFATCENVNIVPKALDKTVGRNTIFVGESSTISSMSSSWIESVRKSGRFRWHQWNTTKTIDTTTFDLLIKEYGKPAFCKIDVEGFEYNVLQGLSQPVDMISFEFVSEVIDS